MIELCNLSKSFATPRGPKHVARNINLTLPSGQAVAILGRNGAGKSTLLQMISGNMNPTSGSISTQGSVSFPVGFAGSFHRDLTGAQNAKFVARIYGVDTDAMLDYVERFAALGGHLHMPLRSYSSGMKSRLAFGISMALDFDIYLVDEVTSVGDSAFRAKSSAIFKERMGRSSALVVTHSMLEIRSLCTAGAVLEHGHLTYYDCVHEAIEVHLENMKRLG